LGKERSAAMERSARSPFQIRLIRFLAVAESRPTPTPPGRIRARRRWLPCARN